MKRLLVFLIIAFSLLSGREVSAQLAISPGVEEYPNKYPMILTGTF